MKKNIIIAVLSLFCIIFFVYGYMLRSRINSLNYSLDECGRLFASYNDSVKEENKILNMRIIELEQILRNNVLDSLESSEGETSKDK